MTQIQVPENCGNSPKCRTLADFVSAIALGDAEALAQMVTDDVTWTPVGAKPRSGSDAVCRGLSSHGPATALEVRHLVAHGRSGAVDGISQYGRKKRAFYLVVDFANARGQRIRGITSFSTDIT
jgi:hypothetical protein